MHTDTDLYTYTNTDRQTDKQTHTHTHTYTHTLMHTHTHTRPHKHNPPPSLPPLHPPHPHPYHQNHCLADVKPTSNSPTFFLTLSDYPNFEGHANTIRSLSARAVAGCITSGPLLVFIQVGAVLEKSGNKGEISHRREVNNACKEKRNIIRERNTV